MIYEDESAGSAWLGYVAQLAVEAVDKYLVRSSSLHRTYETLSSSARPVTLHNLPCDIPQQFVRQTARQIRVTRQLSSR